MVATVLNLKGEVVEHQFELIPDGAKLTKDVKIKQAPNNNKGINLFFP